MAANKAIKNRFETCVLFILQSEGGYVNDKYDKGGETKFGISKNSYPMLDIKKLTLPIAKAIYRRDYWAKCNCDALPNGLDLVVFDTAVNMGNSRALHFLKQTDDIKKYLELRTIKYYEIVEKNPSQNRFLKGWINRISKLKKFLNII